MPFNVEQKEILVYQPFVLLLHKLGFHLPADANKLFVRIPDFWTAEILFSIAEKLGPILKSKNLKFWYQNSKINTEISSTENLKFDIKLLRKSEHVNMICDDIVLSPYPDTLFTSPPTLTDSDMRWEILNNFKHWSLKNKKPQKTFMNFFHSSINRCTPEASPSNQNWIQMVMQTKSSER